MYLPTRISPRHRRRISSNQIQVCTYHLATTKKFYVQRGRHANNITTRIKTRLAKCIFKLSICTSQDRERAMESCKWQKGVARWKAQREGNGSGWTCAPLGYKALSCWHLAVGNSVGNWLGLTGHTYRLAEQGGFRTSQHPGANQQQPRFHESKVLDKFTTRLHKIIKIQMTHIWLKKRIQWFMANDLFEMRMEA